MNNRIEKVAQKVLSSAGQNDSPPVEPDMIADHLGLPITYEKFSDDLSGVLIRKPGTRSKIVINSANSVKRQRFSIAHECGHYVLNHPGEIFVDNYFLNRRDVRSSYAIDSKEIEANAFAAAILMPQALILALAVKKIEENPTGTQQDLIRQLAELFVVSEQAMGYRLINLGIVTTSGD